MTLVIADRVRETSTTTGTSTFVLAGAVVGYQSFSSAIGNTNTTYYTIYNQGTSEWEVGIGTISTGSLTRTSVLASSNANALVNFSAGTKDVFVTYPAEKAVYLDSAGNATIAGTFSGSFSGSVAATTLSASSTVSGTGFSTYLASPPAIGGTTPAAGAFTTLSASSTVTLSGGTANGVLYLNGSKVATSGSALTFDGSNLAVPAEVYRTTDSSYLRLAGGNPASTGASILMFGSTHATNPNRLALTAPNSTATSFIDFSAGGSEQMRLTSTGLGIGTSSPSYKLDVNATQSRFTNGTRSLFTYLDSAGAGIWDTANEAGQGVYLSTANSAVSIYTGSTNRLTVDSSGNLGLGVTPSGWYSNGYKTFQNGWGSFYSGASNTSDMIIGYNSYIDTSGVFKYIGNSYATYYEQYQGKHAWYTAPSGTAGNAISFTQAMTLDASGNLGIGTSSPATKLHVYSTSARQITSGNASSTWTFGASGSTFAFKENSAGAEQLILDSSGNLGLGVTPSAWASGWTCQQVGYSYSLMTASVSTAANSWYQMNNAYYDGAFKYKNNGFASSYEQGTVPHVWKIAASGTAGNAISFTQAMTIEASGNLLVGGTTGTAGGRLTVTTANGGYAAIEPTSNVTSQIATGLRLHGNINETDRYVGIFCYNGAANNVNSMTFWTTNSGVSGERMRIDSSGNLLVGTTSDYGSLHSKCIIQPSSTTGTTLFVNTYSNTGTALTFYSNISGSPNSAGSITLNGATTTYNTSSDYRLKNITSELTGYKERILALQPKQGTWKADSSEFRGFLAHEFAEQYPSAVSGEKDAVDEAGNPKYQGMQAGGSETIADLVALVKELVTELDTLKSQLGK